MAKEKAKVILSYDVHRKIKWLTKNLNTEIGAVGTGGIKTYEGEKCFYIEKLYFPKQEVSGATVHFTASMWGDIVKTVPMEELGKIMFYWHSHPGSAHHSQVDEEDTFETFMSPEANRKYFIFLQTAYKHNGEFDTELRIDIRTPIRHTILPGECNLLYELSPKDIELEKECNKIIKDCIIEKPKEEKKWNYSCWKNNNNSTETGLSQLFGTHINYMDNDIIKGHSTSQEEKVSINFINGCVKVLCGSYFTTVMNTALEKNGRLYELVKRKEFKPAESGDKLNCFVLQPEKKAYNNLKLKLQEMFKEFNAEIEKTLKLEEEKQTIDQTTDSNYQKLIQGNPELCKQLIDMVSEDCLVEKIEGTEIYTLYNLDNGSIFGSIFTSKDLKYCKFTGEELVNLIEGYIMIIENDILNTIPNGGL